MNIFWKEANVGFCGIILLIFYLRIFIFTKFKKYKFAISASNQRLICEEFNLFSFNKKDLSWFTPITTAIVWFILNMYWESLHRGKRERKDKFHKYNTFSDSLI